MCCQYLLANNDSAETITVKLKHCGKIRNSIGITLATLATLFIADFVEIYKVFAINNLSPGLFTSSF